MKNLSDIKGFILGEGLTDKDRPDFKPRQVEKYMGLPYDFEHSWNNKTAYDCSKIAGELFEIPPAPMDFNAPIWQNNRSLPRGELGLSPDEIYIALKNRSFNSVPVSCGSFMRLRNS